MEKLNVVLIDDENLALELNSRYVSNCAELNLCGKFKNPLDAIAYINANPVDLIFVDIEMPQLKGIDLVKQLNKKPAVVFCTAYSEYAAKAFDLDAVDYLVKPFGFERFLRSVEKVKEYYEIRKSKDHEKESEISNDKGFLVIKADHKMVRVPFNEIIYVEGLGEYVKIICENSKYVTFQRMKIMEEMLPASNFKRIHKSYIVSLAHIQSMQAHSLVMKGGGMVQVSRDKKEELVKLVFKNG
ncbi:MAG: response regulator transcription factor [Bacteroidia bacterium]|nr:response regulator transcription factor [Bacteroidia bacterium]